MKESLGIELAQSVEWGKEDARTYYNVITNHVACRRPLGYSKGKWIHTELGNQKQRDRANGGEERQDYKAGGTVNISCTHRCENTDFTHTVGGDKPEE